MGLIETLGLRRRRPAAAPTRTADDVAPPPPPDLGVVAPTGGGTGPKPQVATPVATPPGGTAPKTGAKAAPQGAPAKAPPVTAKSPALVKQLADFDAALAAIKPDIDALGIPALQASLEKELATLTTARTEIGKLVPTNAAAAANQVAAPLARATALRKRVADLRAEAPQTLANQKNWAVDPVETLKTLVDGQPAQVKTIIGPQLVQLRKRLDALRWQIDKGDFKAAKTISEEVFFTSSRVTRAVNDFATDFPAYQVERDKAEKAIKALKAHGQAALIAAEIKDLEQRLLDSDGVASKAELKGWEKATLAVKQLPALCARVKTLADKLAKAAAKKPALKKALQDAGADEAQAERMAGYAQKMLVEENCSDEEAVKLAQETDGFVRAGLDETDALVSSRVKRSLVAGGTNEDVAQEIGKNLRAGGSSSADDAKAVAQKMKGMSKKVLEELNKAGIQTECCRGPVTDALPELSGVLPRGWPAGSTWDTVPGVYSGTNKKVLVGTMDDGGKRKVPGPNEGPVKHGTPDLLGHEAGHAFDAADGSLKSTNAKFLEARTEDITTGNPGGMWGPRDNYFLTTAEGGTNNAGATSETFAESFAMHFAGNSRWPKLEAFWAANPWGA